MLPSRTRIRLSSAARGWRSAGTPGLGQGGAGVGQVGPAGVDLVGGRGPAEDQAIGQVDPPGLVGRRGLDPAGELAGPVVDERVVHQVERLDGRGAQRAVGRWWRSGRRRRRAPGTAGGGAAAGSGRRSGGRCRTTGATNWRAACSGTRSPAGTGTRPPGRPVQRPGDRQHGVADLLGREPAAVVPPVQVVARVDRGGLRVVRAARAGRSARASAGGASP